MPAVRHAATNLVTCNQLARIASSQWYGEVSCACSIWAQRGGSLLRGWLLMGVSLGCSHSGMVSPSGSHQLFTYCLGLQ
eukprot:1158705-Pelagomonas_calceolata.AAC.17